MLNTLKWFLITILIILTLGIIGVGVYASQRLSSVERKFNVEIKEIRKEIKELKKGVEQLKNKVFVEPEEISEIDTSDWETYQSEKYRFEIKFPKGAEIKKEKEGEKESYVFYVFIDFPTRFISDGPGISKNFKILIVSPNHCSPFDEMVSELTFTGRGRIIEGPKIIHFGNMEFIKMVNGEPAAESEHTVISYTLSREDRCFILVFHLVSEKGIPRELMQQYNQAFAEEKSLCDQMISTFRLF